jgi:hypothetical protein
MSRNIIFVLNLGGWASNVARNWNAFAYIFKEKSEGNESFLWEILAKKIILKQMYREVV